MTKVAMLAHTYILAMPFAIKVQMLEPPVHCKPVQRRKQGIVLARRITEKLLGRNINVMVFPEAD